MATAGGSFQKVIRRRLQAGFVGRAMEIVQFRANLALSTEDPDRQFIFSVHGDGGVGKSFLLHRWADIARGTGAVTCWVDAPVFGVPDAMRAIAADLTRQGTETEGFIKLLDSYQQRRFEAESDPDAPSGLAALMTQTAVRMGLHAAHAVPGVGGIADSVDADALATQADQLRVFLGRKFRRHEDVRLLLSPLDVLTPVLIRDLADAGRRHALALFFDTYEQTGLVLDGWVRSVLDGAYGELPEDLVVTVAGRSPLETGGWASYLGVMADVPLKPFTDAEARQFLAERRISDDRVIQVILNVSGKLPLLLATLAENQPADPDLVGDPSGDAVERFLKWETDPARRTLALAAALPRVVNEDVLTVLLADGAQQDVLFAWLRSLPFIADNAGLCQYHAVVRTAMLRLERRQSPVRWKERHHALATAYRTWRLDHSREDAWDDPAWRTLRLEQTYHLLCADPGNALAEALSEVVRACADQPSTAAQWALAITQAGQDADADMLRACGWRLEEALRMAPEEAIIACLGVILSDGRLPTATVALALRVRGRALYYLNREAEALVDLDKSVALAPDDSASLSSRGETYRWLGRYKEALADFDRAIELDPGDAWVIARRGQTYGQMSRYEEALADFDRAIELDPGDAWVAARRGQTYGQKSKYEEALADQFIVLLEKNRDKLPKQHKPTIVVTGQTGVGKTTTINTRFGVEVGQVGYFSRGTNADELYEWESHGHNVDVVDLPGLETYGGRHDREYRDIYRRRIPEADGFIVVVAPPRPANLATISTVNLLLSCGVDPERIVFAYNRLGDITVRVDAKLRRLRLDGITGPASQDDKHVIDEARRVFHADICSDVQGGKYAKRFPLERVVPYDAVSGWNLFAVFDAVLETLPGDSMVKWRHEVNRAAQDLLRRTAEQIQKQRHGDETNEGE